MNKIALYYFLAGFIAAFVLFTLLRPSVGRYQLAGDNATAQIDTTSGTVWILDTSSHKWVDVTKLSQ